MSDCTRWGKTDMTIRRLIDALSAIESRHGPETPVEIKDQAGYWTAIGKIMTQVNIPARRAQVMLYADGQWEEEQKD